MKKYFDTVESVATGKPVASADVAVKTAAGELVALYSDELGASGIDNPIETDSSGYFEFYVADGNYTLEISYDGVVKRTITDVEIESVASTSAIAAAAASAVSAKADAEAARDAALVAQDASEDALEGAEAARDDADNIVQAVSDALAAGTVSDLVATRIYTSRALLNADLVPADNLYALVVGDATAANNDLYQKNGATTTGSWDGPLGFFASASALAVAAASLVTGLYLSTETIGRPVAHAPASGTSTPAGTFIFAKPFANAGIITAIRAYSPAGNTIKVRRFTKAGNDFTQTGSDTNVVLSTGPNTKAVSISHNAGEYIGWYTPASAVSFETDTSDSDGLYSSTGDQTAFTDATIATASQYQIGFDSAYNPVTGDGYLAAVADADLGATVAEGQLATQVIGAAATITGTNTTGPFTFIYAEAVEADGWLRAVRAYSAAGAQITVRRFTKAGNDFTAVGSDHHVQLAAGANTIPLNIAVEEGDYLGYWAPTGSVTFTATAAESGGYYSTGSNSAAFTDAATTTSINMQVGFDVKYPTVTAQTGIDAAAARIVTDQLIATETIGATTTPATGSQASVNTHVFGTPAQHDGIIRTIKVYGGSAGGAFKFRVFELAGGTFTQVGTDTVLAVAANTLNTFSDLEIAIEAGQYYGWYSPADGYTFINTSPAYGAGWYRSNGPDSTSFSAGTLYTSAQLQVQILSEYVAAGGQDITALDTRVSTLELFNRLDFGGVESFSLAVDGNSYTVGTEGYTPWPTLLSQALGITIPNFGVGGQNIAAMIADAVTEVDPVATGDMPILIPLEWYNTMIGSNISAAACVDLMETYCLARRAAGFTIGLPNMLVGKLQSWLAAGDVDAVNAQIDARWTGFADFLIDWREVPQLADFTNATYFDDDQVHPNNAGHIAMAKKVRHTIRDYLRGL